MENIFKSFNYTSENIIDEWHDTANNRNFHRIIDSYINDSKEEKTQNIIESLRIFSINVNKTFKKEIYDQDEKKLENEEAFFKIFELVLNEIKEKDLKKNENINNFTRLFADIAKHHLNSSFKFFSLSSLLKIITRKKLALEKLNEEQVKVILKSLEFDIELNDYFYEKISNEFRYSVERFLDSFSEDSFIKNIKSIQKLFE